MHNLTQEDLELLVSQFKEVYFIKASKMLKEQAYGETYRSLLKQLPRKLTPAEAEWFMDAISMIRIDAYSESEY